MGARRQRVRLHRIMLHRSVGEPRRPPAVRAGVVALHYGQQLCPGWSAEAGRLRNLASRRRGGTRLCRSTRWRGVRPAACPARWTRTTGRLPPPVIKLDGEGGSALVALADHEVRRDHDVGRIYGRANGTHDVHSGAYCVVRGVGPTEVASGAIRIPPPGQCFTLVRSCIGQPFS